MTPAAKVTARAPDAQTRPDCLEPVNGDLLPSSVRAGSVLTVTTGNLHTSCHGLSLPIQTYITLTEANGPMGMANGRHENVTQCQANRGAGRVDACQCNCVTLGGWGWVR
jgi:hypothetical protein